MDEKTKEEEKLRNTNELLKACELGDIENVLKYIELPCYPIASLKKAQEHNHFQCLVAILNKYPLLVVILDPLLKPGTNEMDWFINTKKKLISEEEEEEQKKSTDSDSDNEEQEEEKEKDYGGIKRCIKRCRIEIKELKNRISLLEDKISLIKEGL
jgi:hypothetical protein